MTTDGMSNVEALLATAVEKRVGPGEVVVVAVRDGSRETAHAGTLTSGGDEPVPASTMFRLMSITKAFASVAAPQLIERGCLELDQPVASVLPAFDDLHGLEGLDGDRPRLRAPVRPTTMRHLLTHTAGHGYAFASGRTAAPPPVHRGPAGDAPRRERGLGGAAQLPLLDRTAGVAAAFLTQVLPFLDLAIIEAARAIEQAVYASIAAPA